MAGCFVTCRGSGHSGTPEVLSITFTNPEAPVDAPLPELRLSVEASTDAMIKDSPDGFTTPAAITTKPRDKFRTLPVLRRATPNISGSETMLLNCSRARQFPRWGTKIQRWLSAPTLSQAGAASCGTGRDARNMLLPPLLRGEDEFSFFCLDHDGRFTHFSQPGQDNQDSEDETGHCSLFSKSREEVESGIGFYIHFSQPQPDEDEEEEDVIMHFGQPQKDEEDEYEQIAALSLMEEGHYTIIGQSQDTKDEGEGVTPNNQPQDNVEGGHHYERIWQPGTDDLALISVL